MASSNCDRGGCSHATGASRRASFERIMHVCATRNCADLGSVNGFKVWTYGDHGVGGMSVADAAGASAANAKRTTAAKRRRICKSLRYTAAASASTITASASQQTSRTSTTAAPPLTPGA